MSKEENRYFDIAQALGRVESKLDSLKNATETYNTKVLYALVAIIGATVGVEFLPQSPINLYYSIIHCAKFMAVFFSIFLTCLLYNDYKNKS